MNGELDELYREVVLDHHRRPRGAQPLDRVDLSACGNNQLCGDTVELQLTLDGDRVAAAAVQSHGCAIATASGSMLAELVRGRTLGEARRLAAAFQSLLRGEPVPTDLDLGDLAALSGVRKFPVRVKCALLPWLTLVDGLQQREARDDRP